MRFGILLFIFKLICLSGFAQTASSDLAFDERIFNFGKINEADGKVSHTFAFKNIGTNPVIISHIVTGCGCVGKEYTRKAINPGERGIVTITYNPAYRPGDFSREITIYSNGDNQINWLKITGHVVAYNHPIEEDFPYTLGKELYFSLKVLYFPRIAVGDSAEITLKYASNDDEDMELAFSIEGNNPNIFFANPDKLKAKERGEFVVRYTMTEAIKREFSTEIYPIVNGERLEQPLLLKVMGTK